MTWINEPPALCRDVHRALQYRSCSFRHPPMPRSALGCGYRGSTWSCPSGRRLALFRPVNVTMKILEYLLSTFPSCSPRLREIQKVLDLKAGEIPITGQTDLFMKVKARQSHLATPEWSQSLLACRKSAGIQLIPSGGPPVLNPLLNTALCIQLRCVYLQLLARRCFCLLDEMKSQISLLVSCQELQSYHPLSISQSMSVVFDLQTPDFFSCKGAKRPTADVSFLTMSVLLGWTARKL